MQQYIQCPVIYGLVFALFVCTASAADSLSLVQLVTKLELRPAPNATYAATLEALLKDATDGISEQFFRGMTAQQSQSGYDKSLGPAMLAFLVRRFDDAGLTVTDYTAFEAFSKYYDGSCHKSSYDRLVQETNIASNWACYARWVQPTIANTSEPTPVSSKALQALQAREIIMSKAAGYAAAQRSQDGDDNATRVSKFAKSYIEELGGKVLDFPKLQDLMQNFFMHATHAEPLALLMETLKKASQSSHPCLELNLPTQHVVLRTGKKDGSLQNTNSGIGMTAPLSQAGYATVAADESDEEMVEFTRRVIADQGLVPTDDSEWALSGLALWYDGICAKQSYASLVSELRMITVRPRACGGSWLVQKGPPEAAATDVIASILARLR